MMKPVILALLLTASAFGQTMYKCPDASGVLKFQQMPCSPTGGGEVVPVKAMPIGGSEGLSDSAKAYLEERDKARQPTSGTATQARSGEVEKECMDMKRRIMQLEEREARGIHTWSKHGYEESHYRRQEYEKLCGSW